MLTGLALLAALALDIPPGKPPGKGCSQTESTDLVAVTALLAAPALLRRRRRQTVT